MICIPNTRNLSARADNRTKLNDVFDLLFSYDNIYHDQLSLKIASITW